MILGRTPEGLIKIKTDDPLGLRAVPCACCCVLPQRDISVQYFGPPLFDYPTSCVNSDDCEHESSAGSSRLSQIVQPPTAFSVPYVPKGEILTYCDDIFQTQQTYPIYSSGCEFYLILDAGFRDTDYRFCDCEGGELVNDYKFNFKISNFGKTWFIALGYFKTFETVDGDTIGSPYGQCFNSPPYLDLPQSNLIDRVGAVADTAIAFTEIGSGPLPKNTPISTTNGGYFIINW